MFGDRVKIGMGAFATVYKAELESSDNEGKVAVKRVDKIPDWNTESVILSKLSHKNIIQWFGCYETPKYGYIVTEYVEGSDLFDMIISCGYLTEVYTRKVFRKVASAVKYMHDNGYAHLDIKPENLLIGTDDRVKLVDFGFSVQSFNKPLAKYQGSPEYASPEILRRKPYLPNPSDIWSLGVTLYLALYGELPFRGKCDRERCREIMFGDPEYSDEISEEANSLIAGMLTRNPLHRLTIDQVMDHPWMSSE